MYVTPSYVRSTLGGQSCTAEEWLDVQTSGSNICPLNVIEKSAHYWHLCCSPIAMVSAGRMNDIHTYYI